MNDPGEPERPEDPGISLPSWVDDAISKSGGNPAAQPNPMADAGPAAEMAVNPPPVAESSPPPATHEAAPAAIEPQHSEPVDAEESPQDARKAATLPWVALAFLFLAAALVVGYLLFMPRAPR
jgi:hypothetical protein